MDDDLYSIAYFSKSTIEGTKEDVVREIESLLTVSRQKNKVLKITGALLYSGGYFSQVLEGPIDAIEELFETIQNDPRHAEVTVLHFNPVENRSFSSWAMALAGIEDEVLMSISEILKSPDELKAEQHNFDLIRVLYDLVLRYEDRS